MGTAVQALGLSLMVGGMLALGAFAAPAVFSGLPRNLAAPVMARIFTRYDVVILISMLLAHVGEYFRWISHAFVKKSRINYLRLGLLGVLTVGVIYSTQVLNPKIEEMNMSGIRRGTATVEGHRFDALHKRSENIYKLELLIAVLLLLLTPFVRQVPVGTAQPAACGEPVSPATEPEPKDCCS